MKHILIIGDAEHRLVAAALQLAIREGRLPHDDVKLLLLSDEHEPIRREEPEKSHPEVVVIGCGHGFAAEGLKAMAQRMESLVIEPLACLALDAPKPPKYHQQFPSSKYSMTAKQQSLRAKCRR